MANIVTLILLSIVALSEINYPCLFHKYMNEFEKNYSMEEYDFRFKQFVENVEHVFELHKSNPEYSML